MKEPKFSDCADCRFFRRAVTPAECNECGAGEFFEPRVSSRSPSDDELMDIFRKNYDE